MSYVQRIIDQVKAKDPDQPEFIQAVTEVVTYLRNMSPFWRDLVNGKRPHVFAE